MTRRIPIVLIASMLAGASAAACSAEKVPAKKSPAKKAAVKAASSVTDTSRGDAMIAAYFKAETAKIAAEDPKSAYTTAAQWLEAAKTYRAQLLDMLGLDPMPPRTPLGAVVTGKIDADEFTVEKLHFQSRPGLYVTGNLYVPKKLNGPAPAVLYVCGHASGKDPESGLITGNKTAYQHHGAWYAQNGYVCLIIDTLGLGEIPGYHHGVYHDRRYWWYSRGYTPAGVEAWNCVRALDYLQTRPEVDGERIGVTGRSGGGAYSWWIAAIDDRIKAAVPVAGITDMENHVVDGVIEGHCDCMYMVNTYRWDYWKVAALVAPRPLLISNTDGDRIFPLEGVERLHLKTRSVYDLLAESRTSPRMLGLNITAGPHLDTQELQVHSFVWMNRFLKKDETKIGSLAVPTIPRKDLKVFDTLPADAVNPKIDESFVPMAEAPKAPASKSEWAAMRDSVMASLREKCFRGWPEESAAPALKQTDVQRISGLVVTTYELEVQPTITLPMVVAARDGGEMTAMHLNVLDEVGWKRLEKDRAGSDAGLSAVIGAGEMQVYLPPRGIGPTKWTRDPKKANHVERRFYLLGQTSDSMRVYDVRRALQAARMLPGASKLPVHVMGERQMAGVALYASLFDEPLASLTLRELPASHREGPHILNVLRYLDVPMALALATERTTVRVSQSTADTSYAASAAERLGWPRERIESLKGR